MSVQATARILPFMATKPKRPRDTNQLAKLVIAIATGEQEDQDPNAGKDPAAVALGRKGGAKGGKARAKKLGKQGFSKLGNLWGVACQR